MNFYPFHIGDYSAHTRHLDLMEDLAYRRMLDAYYLAERPFNGCSADVARLIGMRDHLDAVEYVLNTYFEKTETGWCNARADAEIEKFKAKQEQAARAGRASVQSRMNGRSTDVEQPLNEILTDVQPTKNQEPITKNQIEEANASLSGTPFPPCPQQEILNLYRKHLEHLPQPRVWEGTRAAHLRARWVQAAKPSSYSPNGYKTRAAGLEWWDGFFGYIANETKLSQGFETNGRVWRPDLEWIVNPANFAKIIDGKYQK